MGNWATKLSADPGEKLGSEALGPRADASACTVCDCGEVVPVSCVCVGCSESAGVISISVRAELEESGASGVGGATWSRSNAGKS